MANRRIRRTKSLSGYLGSINEDVMQINKRNIIRSVSANSIGSSEIGEDVVLDNKAISSANYLPGEDGWKIDGYGNAEFANVFVRGDINAESGTIGYWNISQPLVSRTFGTTKLFGTFLESSDLGSDDEDETLGTYVGLYKSYVDEPVAVTSGIRVSNLATVVAADHNYSVGDLINLTFEDDSSFDASNVAVIVTTPTGFTYSNPGPDTSATIDITDISSDGTTVTYVAVNSLTPGEIVTITGATSSAYNLTQVPVNTTDGQTFTVLDTATGSTSTATAAVAATYVNITGSAILAIEDIAGIYLRDYKKVKFDYGYFSSEGLKFSAGETTNILKNPSFETTTSTISSGSWDISTYVTNFNDLGYVGNSAVSLFTNMYRAWPFAGHSGAGFQRPWSITAPVDTTDYILGTIDSAGADRFNLFDDSVDRTIYYNMDVFFHEPVQYIEVDSTTPPTVTSTTITINTTGHEAGIASGSSTSTVATYVMDNVGTAPSYGNKVTITGMTPSSLNKTNVTVSSSDGTTFTVTGTGFTVVAASTVGGSVIRSGLSVGDIVYTSPLEILGLDSSENVTDYATAPTGEKYFAVTAVPTATSFSITNLWETVPVSVDYGASYFLYRPMRGSTVSTVTIPADDFDKTTTSTLIAATTGTKTLNTSYTGSYLVNHYVNIYSASDPSNFARGVISAVSANTSITVKVTTAAAYPFSDGFFAIIGQYDNDQDFSSTTSTSSLSIAKASRTFATTFTGSYFVGYRVKVSSDADTDNYMEGIITSISSNTNIVVLVDTIGGSGTFADWTFEYLSGSYLDITLVFNGGHDFVFGDPLYLDFSVLGDDGFDYTDSYTGIGEFNVSTYVSNTTVRVDPYNFNPDTLISATAPTSFINSSGFVRPAAAYAVSSPAYSYSYEKLALEFSNGQIKYIKDIATPAVASAWNSTYRYSYVQAYESVYNLLTSSTGIKRFPTKTIEISSVKLTDAYKTLDPDGWAAKSDIKLRVPVGITGGIAPEGGEWYSFVSTVIDNVGLTTGTEFFFGGDTASASSWGDSTEAPNTYSVGSADTWIDISVGDNTSSMDHTAAIGFKSTTSNTLISPAGIFAQDSRYSSHGLTYDDTDIGGWTTGKITSPSFGKTFRDNNFQFGSFSDYSVITYSSGEYLSRGIFGNYKYSGSGLSSYTNDTVTGTEILAYKQTVSVSDGSLLNNDVASVGVWVDGNDTSYATTVADYTEFRSADGTKRTLNAGYVASTTGTLKKKRVVDPAAPDGFSAVSDATSAPHILYRRGTATCTTTSETAGLGSVTLAGYFRTGASGKALINFGGRVTNATSNVGTGISMRVRLGTNSVGTPVTNGTIQSLSVPQVESTGTTNRTDSGATIFFGDPHTTYYAEFLMYTSTSGSTATAYDRHFTVTPII